MESSPTLLMVEPDDAAAREVEAAAASAGWKTLRARDGDGAAKALSGAQCGLVLSELEVPGEDGFELLARLRGLCPGVPVVAMTAENTPENILGALREQAFAYLAKPVDAAALREILRLSVDAEVEPDDIEVVSLRPDWLSLRVRCKQSTADRLHQFFRELAADLGGAQRDEVAGAFRELLLNAIEHGGRSDPGKKVVLAYIRGARSIVYYVRDPGEGFSLDSLPHAAVSNTPDEPFRHVAVRRELGMRPGGFGILLTRRLADELLYSEKGNEAILVKYLDDRDV
jgi:CheY-like chemotaxis protein